MADQIPEEQRQYFQMMFNHFDTNQNGKIDTQELKSLLSMMGKNPESEEELEKLQKEMDHNGDGIIEFQDFLENMAKQMQQHQSQSQ